MRARGSGFFLNTNRAPLGVEFNYAVALGVIDVIGKDRGAVGALSRAPELAVEARSVKDVVAQYQANGALANEVLTQQKRLRTISLLFKMKCESGKTNNGTTAIVTPAKPELT